jgi:Na+/H+ antiporter NhaD/arsenite permease-like protein
MPWHPLPCFVVLPLPLKLEFTVLARLPLFLLLSLSPLIAWADAEATTQALNLTHHWVGYAALGVFAFAYFLAMTEEVTELNKSKPMVLAASLIWAFIGSIYVSGGMGEQAGHAFRACLEGYAELFLFIMVSMAYLNAMEDRGVFDNLRVWLLSKGFSYRKLFWITGIMSFFMSSICNNLTTALLMGAVILAMGKDNRRFVTLACVNVVVATNAGGSFSPFGDITTLLVWQSGFVPFVDFYSLFLPAVVNFALPAMIIHFWIPKQQPAAVGKAPVMKRGAVAMIILFLLTIVTAVCFENLLKLPPAAGMLAGLTYLKFLGFYLQKTSRKDSNKINEFAHVYKLYDVDTPTENRNQNFDVFKSVAALEWDTLLFFYGVMISVGGLSFIGYLTLASDVLYVGMDPTIANIIVGILSAFIDNGTIMFAVLTMHPEISQGQWLLVTLTAGVGGSLLAIGSAAGVGLMGQMKGIYTFSAHLKWMPVIMVGYIGSIAVHFLINGRYF